MTHVAEPSTPRWKFRATGVVHPAKGGRWVAPAACPPACERDSRRRCWASHPFHLRRCVIQSRDSARSSRAEAQTKRRPSRFAIAVPPTVAMQNADLPRSRTGRVIDRFDGYGPTQSQHHSQTLPYMSYRPKAFGSFSPTGWVIRPQLVAFQAYRLKWVLLRNEMVSEFPARQAYSHSASVGSRYPVPSRMVTSFAPTMQ